MGRQDLLDAFVVARLSVTEARSEYDYARNVLRRKQEELEKARRAVIDATEDGAGWNAAQSIPWRDLVFWSEEWSICPEREVASGLREACDLARVLGESVDLGDVNGVRVRVAPGEIGDAVAAEWRREVNGRSDR